MKRLVAFVTLLAACNAYACLDHRQSHLTVVVKDATGAFIEGANVQVEMVNPAFRWGTAVNAFKLVPDPFVPRQSGDTAYDPKVVEEIQGYFNSITFENRMKWAPYESYDPAAILRTVDTARALHAFNGSQGFRVRGHATMWSSSYSVPSDVRQSTDPNYIVNRINRHIDAFHQAFLGRIVDFDLLNEPINQTLIMDKLFANEMVNERIQEYARWFIRAQQADPNARLFINEYNVLNDWTDGVQQIRAYKRLIDAIRDAGAPIAGIGVQAHVDRNLSQQTVRRRLDILAQPMAPTLNHPQGLPGLPIEITELDIGETNSTGNHWYGGCGSPTDGYQAEILENIIVAAFEHPAVQGVTIWGINDSEHWRGNGVLFDDTDPLNWTTKPAGRIWTEYVLGKWWTNTEALTDVNGTAAQSVYKGVHLVTVTVGEQVQQFEWNLIADQLREIVF